MAEFNPALGNPDPAMPDWTSASRGPGVNKSLGTLFEGIGQTVTKAFEVADTEVTNRIEQDIRSAETGLDQELGLSADVVPGEITRSQDGLSRLALAHNQGRVTSEYYYQRLASTMKGLRTKYPGYERQVDKLVQSVTGTDPANAFRKQLLSNLEKVQTQAMARANNDEKFVRENAKYLNPDQQANPDKYGGTNGLIMAINRQKSVEHQFEVEKREAAQNKERAGVILSGQLSYQANASLRDLSDSLGFGQTGFAAKLTEWGKTGFSQEERATVLGSVDGLIAREEQRASQLISDPAFQFVPLDEKRKQIDAALKPLKDIRGMLASGDYNGAAILAAGNKNMLEEDKKALFDANPGLRTAAALGTIDPALGSAIATEAMGGASGIKGFLDKSMAVISTKAVLGGTMKQNDYISSIVTNPKMSQSDKNKTVAGHVDLVTRMIGNKATPPQVVSQYVKDNYAPTANADALWTNVTPDKKIGLYKKMFDPMITEQVYATKDSAAIKAYTDAALDRVKAIPQWQSAIAGVNENVDFSQNLNIQYDDKTNRLRVEVDPAKLAGMSFFQRSSENDYLRRLSPVLEQFNEVMQYIVPMIEKSDVPEQEGVQRVLKELSLSTTAGDQKGVFRYIDEYLDRRLQVTTDALSGSLERSGQRFEGDVLTPGRTAPSTPAGSFERGVQDMSRISQTPILAATIGRGEGDYQTFNRGDVYSSGKMDLTNMTLNDIAQRQSLPKGHGDRLFAVGKYQVIPSTMRGAMKTLGLTGNEKFTPELQERIFSEYLIGSKRPQVEQYLSGNGSLSAASKALAREFASVADPDTGVSYYAGVGGNKASIGVRAIEDALRQERARRMGRE